MQIPLAHVWPGHGPPLMRKTQSASRPARWRLAVALLAILAASATATIGAMRHTSTTFDEVITIAAGARGLLDRPRFFGALSLCADDLGRKTSLP